MDVLDHNFTFRLYHVNNQGDITSFLDQDFVIVPKCFHHSLSATKSPYRIVRKINSTTPYVGKWEHMSYSVTKRQNTAYFNLPAEQQFPMFTASLERCELPFTAEMVDSETDKLKVTLGNSNDIPFVDFELETDMPYYVERQFKITQGSLTAFASIQFKVCEYTFTSSKQEHLVKPLADQAITSETFDWKYTTLTAGTPGYINAAYRDASVESKPPYFSTNDTECDIDSIVAYSDKELQQTYRVQQTNPNILAIRIDNAVFPPTVQIDYRRDVFFSETIYFKAINGLKSTSTSIVIAVCGDVTFTVNNPALLQVWGRAAKKESLSWNPQFDAMNFEPNLY